MIVYRPFPHTLSHNPTYRYIRKEVLLLLLLWAVEHQAPLVWCSFRLRCEEVNFGRLLCEEVLLWRWCLLSWRGGSRRDLGLRLEEAVGGEERRCGLEERRSRGCVRCWRNGLCYYRLCNRYRSRCRCRCRWRDVVALAHLTPPVAAAVDQRALRALPLPRRQRRTPRQRCRRSHIRDGRCRRHLPGPKVPPLLVVRAADVLLHLPQVVRLGDGVLAGVERTAPDGGSFL